MNMAIPRHPNPNPAKPNPATPPKPGAPKAGPAKPLPKPVVLGGSGAAAPPAKPAGKPSAVPETIPITKRAGSELGWVFAVIGLMLLGSALASSYYLAPLSEKVRSPLHPWLRPSGYVGQTAGILAVLIFIFLWLYPLRKKFRWLEWTGVMSKWLDVHVSLALIIPFLGAIHAAWKFEGLIGLGYWSMIVVCLSGVVGRYLYVHIPRGATGMELTAEEISTERRELIAAVAANSGLPMAQVEAVLRSDPVPIEGAGFLKTLALMVQDDLVRRRAGRALRRLVKRTAGAKLSHTAVNEVVKLASREMALTQQARMLAATQRIFRFWHVAHRPFAMAALVAVLVHVGVVVGLGMTWFW
jgi:hypothetical protein